MAANDLDTPTKRSSAIGIGLPFARTGVVPDGGDIDSSEQRQQTSLLYAGFDDTRRDNDANWSLRGRTGERKYECSRCGFQYPQSKVLVHNGRIVCKGPDTTNCMDLPGYRAARKKVILPAETPNEPLPSITEDM